MFSIGQVSVSLRSLPRNRRSRVGANPPRQTTPSASPITHLTRFLACRRGAVALESAIAVVPLIICLVGVFEIVQSVFVRDLLQRAAFQVAYSNALEDSAAPRKKDLRAQYRQAINTEFGGFLNFALAENGVCSPPSAGEEAADFCVTVEIKVYDSPSKILADKPSRQNKRVGFGGNAGDMVVVEVVAVPQGVLGQLQQGFFGEEGMTVTAVRRNERMEAG